MRDELKNILTIWNNGIWHGAKRRFAEKIEVTEATVGKWVNSKGKPFESTLPKMAKELNKSMEELMNLFKENENEESYNLTDLLSAKEWKALEVVAERDLRDVKGMIRWLVQNYAADRLRLFQSHEVEVFEREASVRENQERGEKKLPRRGTTDKKQAAGSDRRP